MMFEMLHPVDRVKFAALLTRAEAGDPNAQLSVARAYASSGVGCAWGPWRPDHDDKACLKWYSLAAQNGNAAAQEELANLYQPEAMNFCRAEKNISTAIKWHLAAAEQGYAPAYRSLCGIYSKDKQDAKAASIWCEKENLAKQDLLNKRNHNGSAR